MTYFWNDENYTCAEDLFRAQSEVRALLEEIASKLIPITFNGSEDEVKFTGIDCTTMVNDLIDIYNDGLVVTIRITEELSEDACRLLKEEDILDIESLSPGEYQWDITSYKRRE